MERMCESLGAVLDLFNLQPYFIEPSSNHKINIILDPSHCAKLIRNKLTSSGILFDGDRNEIKWEYSSKLVAFGRANNFRLSHKLTKRHIEFKSCIMRVRTAVETISNSVANAMQFFADNNVNDFALAGPTIKFIRIFNNLFDVRNTHRVVHQNPNKLKSALNAMIHCQ